MITQDDADELTERIVLNPYGAGEWEVFATVASHGVTVTARNNFARDSRSHDFGADTDDWTMLDGRVQSFSKSYGDRDCGTVDQLRMRICEVVAWAGAHEMLEWLREWNDQNEAVLIHDPHTAEPHVMGFVVPSVTA